MKGTPAPQLFWWSAAGVGLIYLALFLLARRPVALRQRTLAGMVAAVGIGRLGLASAGHLLVAGADTFLTGATLAVAASLGISARLWLVRTPPEAVREQIRTACRGLFLECRETVPGRFRLAARGSTSELRLLPLGPLLQLIILPKRTGPGKAALLVHWLSKQFSGPVPRVRLVLKRRRSCEPEPFS